MVKFILSVQNFGKNGMRSETQPHTAVYKLRWRLKFLVITEVVCTIAIIARNLKCQRSL